MTTYSPDVLLLDPEGDAPVPNGYVAVNTELAWLREATAANGLSAPRVVIRGHDLTTWAKAWWTSRGGAHHYLTSPSRRLGELFDTATSDEVRRLAHALDVAEESWPEPLTVPTVLTALHPNYQAIWAVNPTVDTEVFTALVARWLTMRVADPAAWPAAHLPVLTKWAQGWAREEPAALVLLDFGAVEAETILRLWAGLNAPSATKSQRRAVAVLLPYTENLPAGWVSQAKATWQTELVERAKKASASISVAGTVARWFGGLRAGLSDELAHAAADVVITYVTAHPPALSEELVRDLAGLVATDTLAALAKKIPRPTPVALPTEPEAILRWVTDSYLPYREWQVLYGDDVAAAVSREHALAFGAWLRTAPQQLTGTAHRYHHLHWSQPARTHPRDAYEVVLWVIADGLGWLDARYVARLIHEQTNGTLTTTDEVSCFGLLPTITHFTKDALRAGMPYKEFVKQRAVAQASAASDVRDSQDPVATLAAAAGGSLVVWKPLQPDEIYHRKKAPAVVRRDAQGELQKLARTIRDAVAAVPAGLAVRVLLTTDHGRLLGESSREVTVPAGFESHGRVVYRKLDAPGPEPIPDDNIEWLSPDWFDLPDWVGVIRDERSFKVVREDGVQQGGPDNFQHGGLWPEEVVVPWLTLARNVVPVRLTGTLVGKARPGQVGTLTLNLTNATARQVRLRYLMLTGIASNPIRLDTNATLSGLDTVEMTLSLPNWPGSQRAATARASVTVELPGGVEQTFDLTTTLASDELQSRDADILSDL